MQQIQLTAAHLVQQVLENGRNLNQILEDTLRNKTTWKSSEARGIARFEFWDVALLWAIARGAGAVTGKALGRSTHRFCVIGGVVSVAI